MNIRTLTVRRVVVCLFLIGLVQGSEDEKRLQKDLLKDYSPDTFPVKNASDGIKIKVGITILSLLEVDHKQHVLETLTWIQEEWNDYYLRWDPNEYGNISDVKLPPNKIWIPDVTFYNHGEAKNPFQDTLAIIRQDGNVSLILPGNVKVTCHFDMTYFPLDKHICTMKLGSWVNDGFKMDLELHSEDGADLSSLSKHTMWKVESDGASRNVNFYACCEEPYVDLTFRLKISRKGEDSERMACHINHLIMGILLIAVLLDITVSLRNQFGLVAIVMSFSMAVLMCPESSENFIQAPLIVKHFMSMGFLGLYVILWTIFIQFVYNLNCAMPHWLKRLTIDGKLMKIAGFCVPSNSSGNEGPQSQLGSPGLDINPFTSDRQLNARNSMSQPLTDNFDVKNNGNRDWTVLAVFIDRILKVIWIFVILVISLLCYPTFPSE